MQFHVANHTMLQNFLLYCFAASYI